MSNWPPTCASCGAPVIGGACPRCRRPERELGGPVVFSGGGATVPGVSVVPTITAAGALAVDAPADTVTIPNVTLPPRTMLVVYAGITGDTSEVTISTVTWNGIPMLNSAPTFNFNASLYADCFFLLSDTGGTGDIVAVNADPARDVVFAVADILSGPRDYRQSWFNHSTSPKSSATIHIDTDFTDAEFHALWTKDAVGDPGAWGGGAVAGQGLVIGGSQAQIGRAHV